MLLKMKWNSSMESGRWYGVHRWLCDDVCIDLFIYLFIYLMKETWIAYKIIVKASSNSFSF
jgi:hypothetical protein